MDPLGDGLNFVVAMIRRGQIQNWLRLIASCLVTMIVTFGFTFGTVSVSFLVKGTGILLSFAYGIGTGSSTASVALYILWLKSPLTKNIAILVPSKIEEARIDEMTKEGVTYNERKQ